MLVNQIKSDSQGVLLPLPKIAIIAYHSIKIVMIRFISNLITLGEVVARMDDDSDGIVKLEHVNKVIRDKN